MYVIPPARFPSLADEHHRQVTHFYSRRTLYLSRDAAS